MMLIVAVYATCTDGCVVVCLTCDCNVACSDLTVAAMYQCQLSVLCLCCRL